MCHRHVYIWLMGYSKIKKTDDIANKIGTTSIIRSVCRGESARSCRSVIAKYDWSKITDKRLEKFTRIRKCAGNARHSGSRRPGRNCIPKFSFSNNDTIAFSSKGKGLLLVYLLDWNREEKYDSIAVSMLSQVLFENEIQ